MKRFSELCQEHISTMLMINAILTTFFLPWAAWTVICQCFSALLIGAEQWVGVALTIWSIGNLPCFLLIAIGLPGAMKCCANVYFEDDGRVKEGFRQGRSNMCKYCVYALALWLSLFLAVNAWVWCPLTDMPGLLAGMCVGFALLQFVFVSTTVSVCAVQNLYFTDKFSDTVSNAVKIVLAKPGRTIGCAFLTVLPFALITLLPFVPQMVGWTVVLVVGLSAILLIPVVKHKRTFDEMIEQQSN